MFEFVRVLSDAALVEELAATGRTIATAHARQLALIAELAAREGVADVQAIDKSYAREEVACALRIPSITAAGLLSLACELRRLPATGALLAAGDISLNHARAVVEELLCVDDERVAAAEVAALRDAPLLTAAVVRRRARRAALAAQPERNKIAAEKALADRSVRLIPLPDGMAELHATVSADAARYVFDCLSSEARRLKAADPAEVRSTDQLRADILRACQMFCVRAAA
jgi:hypothetical protein